MVEHWIKTEIGSVAKVNENSLSEKTPSEYEFFYLDIASVDRGKIFFPKEKIRFGNAPSRARRIVQKDDVLMATVRPNLQSFAYFPFDRENTIASTGFAVLRAGDKIDPKFLYHSIFSEYISKQISLLIAGSNYPAINSSEVENLFIYLPPTKEEQKKIAEILSASDRVIETTENLIAAKQKFKKALMQRLFTGRQRFPEFREQEWKEVHLGEIFTEIKDTNDGGNSHSVMTISARRGLVSQEDKFNRVIAGDSLKKYTQLKRGDFAYNKGNSKSYAMGCIYQLESKESALVPFVYICFNPTEKVFSGFYKHWFLAHGLDRQLKKIITSGARGDGLLNVNSEDFFKLKIPLPPFAEQKKIAAVFEACDAEINVLQNKLDALRRQKRGLMQKLLTGKIRVKADAVDTVEA